MQEYPIKQVFDILEKYAKENKLSFGFYYNQFDAEAMQNRPTSGLYFTADDVNKSVEGVIYIGISNDNQLKKILGLAYGLPKENFFFRSRRVTSANGFQLAVISYTYSYC